MAQTAVLLNLNAAVIPFVAAEKGQSIIAPGRGDMNAGPHRDFSGETLEAAANIPQLYWAENVMPTQHGYLSNGFFQFVPKIPATIRVDYELTLFDGESNKGVLAVTENKELWLLSGVGGTWTKLVIPAGNPQTFTGYVTYAIAYGVCYIFLPGSGLYQLNLMPKTLEKKTPVGLDETLIRGIVDSQSYLVAYNHNTIAWSSAQDPLDFTPSETTGAGSGVPEGLRGSVLYCKSISKGFIIYTSAITMASEYTGNTRIPWIFRALNNGSGIVNNMSVSQDNALASHFIWAAGGLAEVNIQQVTQRFPQLTDFLTNRVWEEFNADINEVVRTELQGQVRVRLAMIAARFFCVSYGKPGEKDFEFVNIYDSALQRWGRMRFTHVQCMEIIADSEFGPLTWNNLGTNAWTVYEQSWNSLITWNNETAKAKLTLGFIKADGSIHVATMHTNVSGANGTLVLGRLQMVRGHTCTMHQVTVQGVDPGKTNFDLLDRITLPGNGETYVAQMGTMAELQQGRYTRDYGCRYSGKNHNLIFKGSFNLVSVEAFMSDAGRR